MIVFAADDPAPIPFTRLDLAAGYMEFVDVQDGVYTAVFTVDGRVVDIVIDEDDFDLRLSDVDGAKELQQLLGAYSAANPSASSDPATFANDAFRWQWQRRWPRWPAWLSRRVHGDEPAKL